MVNRGGEKFARSSLVSLGRGLELFGFGVASCRMIFRARSLRESLSGNCKEEMRNFPFLGSGLNQVMRVPGRGCRDTVTDKMSVLLVGLNGGARKK